MRAHGQGLRDGLRHAQSATRYQTLRSFHSPQFTVPSWDVRPGYSRFRPDIPTFHREAVSTPHPSPWMSHSASCRRCSGDKHRARRLSVSSWPDGSSGVSSGSEGPLRVSGWTEDPFSCSFLPDGAADSVLLLGISHRGCIPSVPDCVPPGWPEVSEVFSVASLVEFGSNPLRSSLIF